MVYRPPTIGISNALPIVFWPRHMVYWTRYPWYVIPYPWYVEPLLWHGESLSNGISNPYPWYIAPLSMVYQFPTHDILNPLPMVYRAPYAYYLDPLLMVYRVTYPWFIEPLSIVFWTLKGMDLEAKNLDHFFQRLSIESKLRFGPCRLEPYWPWCLLLY